MKRPKRIWVRKELIILTAYLLYGKRLAIVLVSRQWMFTSHDGRKVNIPRIKVT